MCAQEDARGSYRRILVRYSCTFRSFRPCITDELQSSAIGFTYLVFNSSSVKSDRTTLIRFAGCWVPVEHESHQ